MPPIPKLVVLNHDEALCDKLQDVCVDYIFGYEDDSTKKPSDVSFTAVASCLALAVKLFCINTQRSENVDAVMSELYHHLITEIVKKSNSITVGDG